MGLETRIWASRLRFGPRGGGTEKKKKKEKKEKKEEKEKFPLCEKA